MSGRAVCRARRLATTAMLPLLLSSCFTMALWGFSPETDRDPSTGERETMYEYDEETEWSWPLFFFRVLATPFSLGLDCVTAPVQVFLFGGDDDDC